MRRALLPVVRILAAGLLCLAARGAAAQPAAAKYAGRPIEEVRLLIEKTPASEPAVLDLIEARVGEPVSIGRVRESIEHIYSLGRFQDVQVEAQDAPAGGVRLTFNLIPLHNIRRIEFAGSLGLSEDLLRATVVERYGSSPPLGRVAAAARTLEQLYADRGYLRARVEATPTTLHDPDRSVLTFEIESGPRSAIGQIEIEGDPREPRGAFLQRLDAAPGSPFDRSRIQQRLDDYVQQLKRRRFYEATGALRATESEDGRTADVTISIAPGLPVAIRFEGDPIPKDRLGEFAPLEREGSVDEDLLEDSESRIEGYLRQQGYWKADVTVRREQSDAALAIVFTIKRGLQYRLAAPTDVTGAASIPAAELASLVPLKAGDLFVESQLAAGANAIRTRYQLRGFAAIDVKSAVNETDPSKPGEGLVRAAIAIVEGPRSAVGEVTIAGNEAIVFDELRPLVRIIPGEPFYEPRVIESRDALLQEYWNRGFASATVTPRLDVSDDRSRITLSFTIQEGPQTIVDHILIVGNAKTDSDVILRELQFRPGQPLGLQEQFESRRRLSALGLFRSVRITELTHGSSSRHDVLVTVEESPATTFGYGGGLEATQRSLQGSDGRAEEQIEFVPRGFFDIGRRNLFGANRSVSLYTRVSLRARNPTSDLDTGVSRLGFREYRVVGTYRQPRWFGPNDLTASAVVEQGARTSFNFARRGINLDVVRQLTPSLRASGRYSASSTRTFDEQLSEEDRATIDRLFPRVRLSGFSGAVAKDTRDDLLEPTRGMFLSGEGTVAARALGGQVGFMKAYLQVFSFHRLPKTQRLVFAARASLGLADGFEREVQPTGADGAPLPGPPETVEDLPASERFFAGGDTTIRGFALDKVGTTGPNGTISTNGFPTGGNAVLILNGELRFPLKGDFGAVMFLDGGNVYRRVTEFDLGDVRGAAGLGLRYRSPFGPIRFDVGFKMARRVLGGELEPRAAFHFSLGQAF